MRETPSSHTLPASCKLLQQPDPFPGIGKSASRACWQAISRIGSEITKLHVQTNAQSALYRLNSVKTPKKLVEAVLAVVHDYEQFVALVANECCDVGEPLIGLRQDGDTIIAITAGTCRLGFWPGEEKFSGGVFGKHGGETRECKERATWPEHAPSFCCQEHAAQHAVLSLEWGPPLSDDEKAEITAEAEMDADKRLLDELKDNFPTVDWDVNDMTGFIHELLAGKNNPFVELARDLEPIPSITNEDGDLEFFKRLGRKQ